MVAHEALVLLAAIIMHLSMAVILAKRMRSVNVYRTFCDKRALSFDRWTDRADC
jgi:hypothetical protein